MEENTQDALRCLKDCESMCVCELSNELKERERGVHMRDLVCVCVCEYVALRLSAEICVHG